MPLLITRVSNLSNKDVDKIAARSEQEYMSIEKESLVSHTSRESVTITKYRWDQNIGGKPS